MKNPKQHIKENLKGDYNYLVFDSVLAFNEFVDHQATQLSSQNKQSWVSTKKRCLQRIKSGSDWYGNPTPISIEELELHRTFSKMSLLKEIQPKIKSQLSAYLKYLDAKVLPKPKMSYNDRGLGVFSFDRAAMGMFKNYAIDTTTTIDTSMSQMRIALQQKKLQTSVKKVFVHFENKKSSYPSLEIYITGGANAQIQGSALLYVGLACAELVEFMELRGIPTQINILFGTYFSATTVLSQICLKRYEDRLDKNQLLLMSSDPRYFRYRGFKALIAMSDYFGHNIPKGLGTMPENLGKDFVKQFKPNGVIFEQSYSIDAAVKEVSKIIMNYKYKIDGKT